MSATRRRCSSRGRAVNGRTLKVGQLKDPTKPYDPKTNPYQGKPLHWRVMSGGHTADITLNPGEYTMDDLAARIRNATTDRKSVV